MPNSNACYECYVCRIPLVAGERVRILSISKRKMLKVTIVCIKCAESYTQEAGARMERYAFQKPLPGLGRRI